jgi:membrane protease YdiL (CAAX protease family)
LNFRGFLQQTIGRGLNFRVASLATGVLFVSAHADIPGETPIGLGMILAFALLASYSVWRTGAIWWAVGYHAAWDWAETYVYGVADSGRGSSSALMLSHANGPAWLSGGAAGPEGSVFALAALMLSAAALMTIRKPDENLGLKG